MNYSIRLGTPKDIQALYELICELADFEKAAHEVINTPEQLLEDGFGINPLYGFYVAESDQNVLAIALYYYRYSTWKGKVLYLEDIYVKPAYRGFGIGEALMNRLEEHAQAEGCKRITFQVLHWNEPAIKFYTKIGMQIDKEWWNVYKDLY